MKISNLETINNDVIKKVLFNLPKIEYEHADYMIIFGCHIKEITIERLNRAIEILKIKNVGNIIVTGGIGINGDYNESEFMLDYLINHDIDQEKIIVEDKSTTTEENITNIFELLNERLNNKSLILLSNEPHLKRISMKIMKDFSLYNNELIYEYPIVSKLNFENILNDKELYKMAENEIKKIKKFINDGLLNDEEI